MKHELNNFAILNGKYAIEQYIGYQDNCYKYKATDLVMREEVYIYEFCPGYITGRAGDSDRLSVNESVFVQFSEELKAFESNLSSVAYGKRNDEIAKNYFRENNTGYLVVAENRKALIRRKLLTRVVLGVLAAIVVIEAGILLSNSDKKDNTATNDAVMTEESIGQLIEDETVIAADTDIFEENIDEDIEAKEEYQQYSEEELLGMIEEKSGKVLWGSYDTEENKNIIQKLRDDIGSEYKSWGPGEGENFRASWYEDFNGDGYKEMVALMCNFDLTMFDPELWFSDGNTVERIDIPTKEKNRSCGGLFLVQFGKQKIVQLVYYDDFYTGFIDSVYQYAYENNTLINVSLPNSVFFFQNDKDMNVVAQKVNEEYLYLFDLSEIDKEFYDSLFGTHTIELNTYDGACYNEHFIYYKDLKFYEYEADKISEAAAERTYKNFNIEKEKIEENFAKMSYSYAPGYDGSWHEYVSSELKSIYFGENDKLYLNYEVKGLFSELSGDITEYGGHKYVNGVTTFNVSFCYSIKDDSLEMHSAYSGIHGEKTGLLD